MTARTSMPALSVAIAEFQSRRTATPGLCFGLILPAMIAGIMPSTSDGANSQIRNGELSPWLN